MSLNVCNEVLLHKTYFKGINVAFIFRVHLDQIAIYVM